MPHLSMRPMMHENVTIAIKEKQPHHNILTSIDPARNDFLRFLDSFLRVQDAAHATTASADVIKAFLSQHGIRTLPILRYEHQPNMAALVVGDSDGPNLVMNAFLPVSPENPPVSHDISVSDLNQDPRDRTSPLAVKASTAAIVAAFACLHANQSFIKGSITLIVLSENPTGTAGNLLYLLHEDERRRLFRGDCVLASSPTSLSKLQTGERSVAEPQHPLEEAVRRRAKEVAGISVDFISATQSGYCDRWRDLDIPTYSYGMTVESSSQGLAEGQQDLVDAEDFFSLVKIYTLVAIDFMQVGLPED